MSCPQPAKLLLDNHRSVDLGGDGDLLSSIGRFTSTVLLALSRSWMNAFTQTARFLDRSRRITANSRGSICAPSSCPIGRSPTRTSGTVFRTVLHHTGAPAIDIGVENAARPGRLGDGRVSAPTARECEWTCTRRV